MSSPSAILSNFLEKQLTQNHPQYFRSCVVWTFGNLSRKSCVGRPATQHGSNKLDHGFKRTSFLVVFYYMMLSISIKPVLREISFLCYVKFEIILNSLLTAAKVIRFLPRKIFLDNSMLTLKLFSLLTVVKVLTR